LTFLFSNQAPRAPNKQIYTGQPFCLAAAINIHSSANIDNNVSRMPKLPHSRHDAARAKRVDGDGGFKAAIWGGALAARQTCVSSCKIDRYHSVILVCAALGFLSSCHALYFQAHFMRLFIDN
jgi:hypothetical protein